MEKEAIKVVVVGAVILKENNKYLLVQEKQPKAYKLWNLPAGRIDVGETIEEGAIREAKEETGYEVKLKDRVGIYHENGDNAVKHVFTADIIGGELDIPEDEMFDAKWYSLEEIKSLEGELRAPWILKSILDSEKLRKNK